MPPVPPNRSKKAERRSKLLKVKSVMPDHHSCPCGMVTGSTEKTLYHRPSSSAVWSSMLPRSAKKLRILGTCCNIQQIWNLRPSGPMPCGQPLVISWMAKACFCCCLLSEAIHASSRRVANRSSLIFPRAVSNCSTK